MTHSSPDPNEAHGSVYDGLLGGDPSHWAFGTADYDPHSDDPLAGVDTTLPDGVDGAALAAYCLMLADDALIASHRLSQWCSRAPDLEDDIALANIALDLLGQARLLLARAAAADPACVPVLPAGSPVPPEDALAFFRGDREFRNARMVEAPNGDFGHTVARLMLFSLVRMAVLEALVDSRDPVLAALAVKGVKEVAYHREYAGRWFVTLAQGTEESRRRVAAGLEGVWPTFPELMDTHRVEAAMAEAGVGVDPATLRPQVDAVLDQILAAADLERPGRGALAGVRGRAGRDGVHTEAMSTLLAEMQVVAREHPEGRW